MSGRGGRWHIIEEGCGSSIANPRGKRGRGHLSLLDGGTTCRGGKLTGIADSAEENCIELAENIQGIVRHELAVFLVVGGSPWDMGEFNLKAQLGGELVDDLDGG